MTGGVQLSGQGGEAVPGKGLGTPDSAQAEDNSKGARMPTLTDPPRQGVGGRWAAAGHLWPLSLPWHGGFPSSRSPWSRSPESPTLPLPAPGACPLPAFPGQYEFGVGNHNICCPGDSCQGKGLRWARRALAQRGRRTHAPASALPALRTQQDHSLTTQGKLRPREAGACSEDAKPTAGTRALFPGCPAFPSSQGSRPSWCHLRGVPTSLRLSVPPH